MILSRVVFAGVWICAGIGSLLAQSGRPLTRVAPVEHNRVLTNPHMGWGLWAGPRYFDGRAFTLDTCQQCFLFANPWLRRSSPDCDV